MLAWPRIIKDIISADVTSSFFRVYRAVGNSFCVVVENIILNEDKFVGPEVRRIGPGAITLSVCCTAPTRSGDVHRGYVSARRSVPLIMVNNSVVPAKNAYSRLTQ